ncbi:MAG: hypothetical protein KDD62_04580 [Bdellovibrionales bacterium]|nr:hypothetical protein [Bdellovibrionales bacterium]
MTCGCRNKIITLLLALAAFCMLSLQAQSQELERAQFLQRMHFAAKKHVASFEQNLVLLEPFLTGKVSLNPCLNDPAHACYKPYNEALAATYYDLAHSLYVLADLTKKNDWLEAAHKAAIFYRDGYVFPNEGKIPGYWIFTEGLLKHFELTKDPKSKEALLLLAQNAAFARDTTDVAETVSSEQSREVAYVILAYLRAEQLGATRRDRLELLVEQALQHLKDWRTGKAEYVRPFMVALTARALAAYHDQAKIDPKMQKQIRIELILTLDMLWESLWVPTANAFRYTNRVMDDPEDMKPTADLNLLIAPAYKWLFKSTQLPRFLDRAQKIFNAGAKTAFIDNPKQFNQQLFWPYF